MCQRCQNSVGRLEGCVEVLLETVAEQEGYAYGHVAVAREIAIKLYGKPERSHEVFKAAVKSRVVKHAVDKVARDKVGDDHLFDDAEYYEIYALGCHLARSHGVGLDLRKHILGPHHRTSQQGREKGEVKQIVKRIAARVGVAAVYVDYITYGAECKERDARREQHVDGVDMGGEEVVDGGDEQAEIFEIGQ